MSLAVILCVIFFFGWNRLIAFQCILMGNGASTYDHFELRPSSGMDCGHKSRHHCTLSLWRTCSSELYPKNMFLLNFTLSMDLSLSNWTLLTEINWCQHNGGNMLWASASEIIWWHAGAHHRCMLAWTSDRILLIGCCFLLAYYWAGSPQGYINYKGIQNTQFFGGTGCCTG